MKQFSVLIVDDEIHAIRGVEAGVAWDKLNIATVYTANSLRQAQVVFQSHSVDLLLTDIDMPKGSGLDLLKWVREHYPATEAVFLTAHAEFTYAKQALLLKGFDYLLKPADYKELEEVIENALQKIKKDQQMSKVGESYLHLQKSHQSIMKDRFWLDLINQVIPSTKDKIQHYLQHHKIDIDDSINYLPILIHVQRWKEGLTTEEERMMESALKNAVLEEVAKADENAATIELTTGSLLVILPEANFFDVESVIIRCRKFISKFILYFECDLCCYVGKQTHIYELLDMVQSLKDENLDNVTQTNQVIETHSGKRKQSTILKFPANEWLELMKAGSKEKLLIEINNYIDSWEKGNLNITSKSLHFFYQEFLQLLLYILQIRGMKASQVFSQNMLTGNVKGICASVSSLQEWILLIIDVGMDQLNESHESNSLIDKVKQFIKENIGVQKLSRENIASYVHFNPDYLTRVFKKETGLSLSRYIQQEQIDTAKKLLVNTNKSVSEIALDCGYANFSYFSTIFKKTTDLSPVDFREKFSKK